MAAFIQPGLPLWQLPMVGGWLLLEEETWSPNHVLCMLFALRCTMSFGLPQHHVLSLQAWT